MQFNFECSIQGYHVYKSIWTYEISEKLRCDREENNANDNFAVKLVRNDGNKEHVPIELSKVFKRWQNICNCNRQQVFQYRIRITMYVVRTHFRDKLLMLKN